MTILHSARNLLGRFGLEAFRATPMTMWKLRLPQMLAQQNIGTVLDVGANDGGYARDLLGGGYAGRIISFEPLPDVWERLNQQAKLYPRWEVGPRAALSNVNGEAEFFEAGNGVSSSLLPIMPEHTDAAPASATIASIKVETRRLDDLLPQLDIDGRIFLKLDVQGAEGLVLEGAMDALKAQLVGVQLEMSLTSLYSSQATARELDALLLSLGFECWDILPGFRDARTLRMLQCDGIYFRN